MDGSGPEWSDALTSIETSKNYNRNDILLRQEMLKCRVKSKLTDLPIGRSMVSLLHAMNVVESGTLRRNAKLAPAQVSPQLQTILKRTMVGLREETGVHPLPVANEVVTDYLAVAADAVEDRKAAIGPIWRAYIRI